ncbi:serine/arginine-rich splicing factor RS31-like protein isoform X3 [Tanacetum coccineum]
MAEQSFPLLTLLLYSILQCALDFGFVVVPNMSLSRQDGSLLNVAQVVRASSFLQKGRETEQVPGCSANKHLEPGDVVVGINKEILTQFLKMETLLDDNVSQNVEVLDRVVSVEYALRDDGERGDRSRSPRRDYGRPGDSPITRSISPYRRGRPSPDYGRAHRGVFKLELFLPGEYPMAVPKEVLLRAHVQNQIRKPEGQPMEQPKDVTGYQLMT